MCHQLDFCNFFVEMYIVMIYNKLCIRIEEDVMKAKVDYMKVCAQCEYATPLNDANHQGLYMCKIKGLKNEMDKCHRFSYNPLVRDPKRKIIEEIEAVEI